MGKFFDTILDRVFAVLGALIFSQAPAFIQQYIQRLAGSAHELKLQVDQIHKIAAQGGLTIPQYMEKFKASSDALFQAQGEMVGAILARYETLSHALASLEHSWWFTRPFTFLIHMQTDLFYGTIGHYTPAFNVSIEGIVWAFAGLLIGCMIYKGFKKAVLGGWSVLRNAFKRKNESQG